MRKIYLVLLATILSYASSFGQNGKSFIGVGADVCVPTGEFGTYFKTGAGGYVKALLGVGKSGQVTFTTGYSSFKAVGDFPLKTGTVPLLMGYRANFNGFFVEPQLGYSINNAMFMGFDDVAPEKSAGGTFMWAAGLGYVFNNKIEVGVRYQTASAGGSTMALFGLRLGYNFSLNGAK